MVSASSSVNAFPVSLVVVSGGTSTTQPSNGLTSTLPWRTPHLNTARGSQPGVSHRAVFSRGRAGAHQAAQPPLRRSLIPGGLLDRQGVKRSEYASPPVDGRDCL